MKKINILFYSVLVLLLQSCLEEKMPSGGQLASSPYFLRLNRNTLTLSASEDATGSIYVSSKNTPWAITGAPYWLKVSPKSGSTDAVVTVTATRNMSTDNTRVAVLTFQSTVEEYAYTRNINVTQQRASAPAARLLSATQDAADDAGTAMYFGRESAQNRLQIADATDWSAAVSDDWIALSQYSGDGGETVVISARANDGESERTGCVTIVTEEQVLRVSVVQQGRYLDISSAASDVEAGGDCIELALGKAFGAEACVEYLGESNGWVAVESDGDGNYTLHVAGNPSDVSRMARFIIKPTIDGASGIKFNITQCGVRE